MTHSQRKYVHRQKSEAHPASHSCFCSSLRMQSRIRVKYSTLIRFACVLLALTPTPAFAHARLLRSLPASGVSVGSVSVIQLWFSERTEIRFTSVVLRDQKRNDLSHIDAASCSK